MNVLIIDGQGGGIGKQVAAMIKEELPEAVVTAVGTNSTATAAMLKAGADFAATGENAIIVNCRRADVVIGPIGIVIADSLMGEITPNMSVAIGQSNAKKILIPVNHCENFVVGVPDLSIVKLIRNAVDKLKELQCQSAQNI